jgi:hypothetical protein
VKIYISIGNGAFRAIGFQTGTGFLVGAPWVLTRTGWFVSWGRGSFWRTVELCREINQ